MDYQKLYHKMFNAATDAVRCLEVGKIYDAIILLVEAQCACEELYMEEAAGDD